MIFARCFNLISVEKPFWKKNFQLCNRKVFSFSWKTWIRGSFFFVLNFVTMVGFSIPVLLLYFATSSIGTNRSLIPTLSGCQKAFFILIFLDVASYLPPKVTSSLLNLEIIQKHSTCASVFQRKNLDRFSSLHYSRDSPVMKERHKIFQ